MNKHLARILMLAIMIVGVRGAHADDDSFYLLNQLGQQASVWWRQGAMWGVRGSSKACMDAFNKVAAVHVPETATHKLTTPAPGVEMGDHPWPEARPVCERMLQAERMVWAQHWLGLARQVVESTKRWERSARARARSRPGANPASPRGYENAETMRPPTPSHGNLWSAG